MYLWRNHSVHLFLLKVECDRRNKWTEWFLHKYIISFRHKLNECCHFDGKKKSLREDCWTKFSVAVNQVFTCSLFINRLNSNFSNVQGSWHTASHVTVRNYWSSGTTGLQQTENLVQQSSQTWYSLAPPPLFWLLCCQFATVHTRKNARTAYRAFLHRFFFFFSNATPPPHTPQPVATPLYPQHPPTFFVRSVVLITLESSGF